jgi:hypothetical protein
MINQQVIDSPASMELAYQEILRGLLASSPIYRGKVHAQDTDQNMFELNHMTLVWDVDTTFEAWQETVKPNLPWAEDHFRERISGEPLNPPPSEAYWPFAQSGNAAHKEDQVFSHTYPERFWPKMANVGGVSPKGRQIFVPHVGIRFEYGDLEDLITVLQENPRSRQAYLPVWFPEDLTAAVDGKRVPCSLGYHFLSTSPGLLDCTYSLRSCDVVRFFRDDVYMAGRLLHFVSHHSGLVPGNLVVHISNLHAFEADSFWMTQQLPQKERPSFINSVADKRSRYNFDALG